MSDLIASNVATACDLDTWKVLHLRSPCKRVKRKRIKLHWSNWFNIPIPILHLETFEFEPPGAPIDHEALANQLQQILQTYERLSYELFTIMPLSSGYHGIISTVKPSPYNFQRTFRQMETRWASDTFLILLRKKSGETRIDCRSEMG